MTKQIWLLLPIVLSIGGCSSTPRTSERSPIDSEIFREEWFDYYNRAARRIATGNVAEAERDLQAAVSLRPKESHRARTYGVHFQRYYPHRELGIIAYHKGSVESAEQELLRSLSEASTSKGMHFLNETRRRKIRTQRLDEEPPTVTVDFPPRSFLTNKRTITVRGTVSDDTYVEHIRVAGAREFIELAEPAIPFAPDVDLVSGDNLISIVASDLAGRRTETKIDVIVDVDSPSLGLDEVRVEKDSGNLRVWIRGGVFDRSGIDKCTIGDVEFEGEGRNVDVKRWFQVSPGEEALAFYLRDRCGNESRGKIDLKDESGRWKTARASASQRIRLACADPVLAMNLASMSVIGRIPRIRPGVRKSPRAVYQEEFFLTGTAHDEDGIESICINDEPRDIHHGQDVYFAYLADLKEGTNTFRITATDKTGQVASETVELVLKRPAGLQYERRLCVATCLWKTVGDVSDLETETILSQIQKEIAEYQRFLVFERDKLGSILREQEIAGSSLAEQKFPARIAEIIPADLVVFIKILGDRDGFDIYMEVRDVDNICQPISLNVYHPRGDDLKLTAKGLYLLLEDQFPLAQGKVLRLKKTDVLTSLNREDHRIRNGTLLYVFRHGKEIIEDGINYGKETTDIGRLSVKWSKKKMSGASVEQLTEGAVIQENDIVITE